jgi:HK97 family phage portal protein
MSFWRRSEQRTLTQPTLQPLLTYWPIDSNVTPITALATPNVFACVRVLADAAASCPLIPYRRAGDDGRRRASGRTAELLRAPAEGMTQANLVSTLVGHLTTWGNSYLGKYRDENGRVDQLLPMSPDRVQVERRAGRIRFLVSEGGRQNEHGLDDIIHIKALSTDGLVGLSPIKQMRLALELDNAVREASTSLFKNHGRPSGILSSQHRLSKEQAELLREQWYANPDRGGSIAFMDGTMEFTALSMPADDAQFVDARKLSATEVARAFRLPPWMIGAEGGGTMTYSNVESQMLSFVMLSLRPWLTVIEQALTADRDLFGPSSFCEFLIDGLLRADSMTRAQIYEKALDPITGWMRRDEVRRLENLEPEPTSGGLNIPPVVTATTNGAGVIT